MKPHFERLSPYIFAVALLFCACFAHAQNVSPFMALGNAQFFDNNGNILTSGVLYTYQAGTTTQQITFTDSTGTTANPDPVPLGSGARASIWLISTANYKFVLCLQNDGAACAPSDVLFSMDHVPGCLGCASGSTSFTGTFISGTSNPATTGILELASIDSICWRNTAGNANLCIAKDSSDVLTWTGATTKWPESSCVLGAANEDYLCPNSATHHLSVNNNNGGYGSIPGVAAAAIAGDLAGFATNGIDLVDSGGTPPASAAVTFSATPTFAATSQDQLFTMSLAGNVTGSTLTMTGLPVPSVVSFELTQDATGNRTFVWPSNVLGAIAPTSTANAVTMERFVWDGTNARAVTLTPVLPAVQASSTTLLGASTVSVSVNTPTVFLTKSITMPSTGCPCRVLGSYQMVYQSGSGQGGVAAWISDGSAVFATGGGIAITAINGGEVNATAMSTATYSNSQSVTFTANVQTNISAGITVEQTPLGIGSSIQTSYLNLNVMASN